MRLLAVLVLAGVFAAGGCGDEAGVYVTVELGTLRPVLDVDAIYLDVVQGGTPKIGRSFPLKGGDRAPTYFLVPGERIEGRFSVAAYGLKNGAVVGFAGPADTGFFENDPDEITLILRAGTP